MYLSVYLDVQFSGHPVALLDLSIALIILVCDWAGLEGLYIKNGPDLIRHI